MSAKMTSNQMSVINPHTTSEVSLFAPYFFFSFSSSFTFSFSYSFFGFGGGFLLMAASV
jgi:hypothetical protein